MVVMGRNLGSTSKAVVIPSLFSTVPVKRRKKWLPKIRQETGFPYTVKEFVESLETPRRILLMVKAGAGTDAAIDSLKPYLDKGDIIIDGGNTFFGHHSS